MTTNNKIMFFLVATAIILLQLSCSVPQRPVPLSGLLDVEPAYQRPATAARFRRSAPQGPTAVESAIELSEKHAMLSEEAAQLRERNKSLIVENGRLKEKSAAADAQLQQVQKELTEANAMLMEMVVELNSWKSDVIGFREEMRVAEKAQLQTLLRILEALGGEVNPENAHALSQPARPKTVALAAADELTLAAAQIRQTVRPQHQKVANAGQSDE
jgi:chromosome segregation ATPase